MVLTKTRPMSAPAPRRRERDIQREILRLLHAHGVMAFGMNREHAGYRRASHIGVKGLPDIMGWVPVWAMARMQATNVVGACPLFIEVKRPGGKLRPAQEAFLAMARKDGCVAFKADSPAQVAKELGWT